MKVSCDIIRDLLPLYNDKVCSSESGAIVEEHLKECPDCSKELIKMKDNFSVTVLTAEQKDVIGTYRRNVLKKVWFFAVCVLLIPLINSLIALSFSYSYNVFLASLNIFVISAAILLNSVYFPSVIKHNKKNYIIISSIVTPILIMPSAFTLYLCQYVVHWEHQMFTLYMGVPFFLYMVFSIVFIPLKTRADSQSSNRYKKGITRLAVMETLIMLVWCLWYGPLETYLQAQTQARLTCVLPQLIFLWAAAMIFRFVKAKGLFKASIYTALSGLYLSLLPAIEYFTYLPYFHVLDPKNYFFWKVNLFSCTVYQEKAALAQGVLIIFTIIALTLAALGIAKKRKKAKAEKVEK